MLLPPSHHPRIHLMLHRPGGEREERSCHILGVLVRVGEGLERGEEILGLVVPQVHLTTRTDHYFNHLHVPHSMNSVERLGARLFRGSWPLSSLNEPGSVGPTTGPTP